ncbi:MAG: four helix bundle protein [Acidobacteriota bacterium]|nr:four helix bundle protein [Acidobacteriota bacterium]
MRPHEKLDVWKRSMDLVVRIYKATEVFPTHERYGLTSQIRRAAVSIPANIAEGAARQSSKEFAHFLSNAQGSASELETELLIAQKLEYLDSVGYFEMRNEIASVGRMLIGLAQSVRRNFTSR